jgi:hypothetical protein
MIISLIEVHTANHWIVITDKGKYPWSFVTQIFHSSQQIRGSDRKSFEVMTYVS